MSQAYLAKILHIFWTVFFALTVTVFLLLPFLILNAFEGVDDQKINGKLSASYNSFDDYVDLRYEPRIEAEILNFSPSYRFFLVEASKQDQLYSYPLTKKTYYNSSFRWNKPFENIKQDIVFGACLVDQGGACIYYSQASEIIVFEDSTDVQNEQGYELTALSSLLGISESTYLEFSSGQTVDSVKFYLRDENKLDTFVGEENPSSNNINLFFDPYLYESGEYSLVAETLFSSGENRSFNWPLSIDQRAEVQPHLEWINKKELLSGEENFQFESNTDFEHFKTVLRKTNFLEILDEQETAPSNTYSFNYDFTKTDPGTYSLYLTAVVSGSNYEFSWPVEIANSEIKPEINFLNQPDKLSGLTELFFSVNVEPVELKFILIDPVGYGVFNQLSYRYDSDRNRYAVTINPEKFPKDLYELSAGFSYEGQDYSKSWKLPIAHEAQEAPQVSIVDSTQEDDYKHLEPPRINISSNKALENTKLLLKNDELAFEKELKIVEEDGNYYRSGFDSCLLDEAVYYLDFSYSFEGLSYNNNTHQIKIEHPNKTLWELKWPDYKEVIDSNTSLALSPNTCFNTLSLKMASLEADSEQDIPVENNLERSGYYNANIDIEKYSPGQYELRAGASLGGQNKTFSWPLEIKKEELRTIETSEETETSEEELRNEEYVEAGAKEGGAEEDSVDDRAETRDQYSGVENNDSKEDLKRSIDSESRQKENEPDAGENKDNEANENQSLNPECRELGISEIDRCEKYLSYDETGRMCYLEGYLFEDECLSFLRKKFLTEKADSLPEKELQLSPEEEKENYRLQIEEERVYAELDKKEKNILQKKDIEELTEKKLPLPLIDEEAFFVVHKSRPEILVEKNKLTRSSAMVLSIDRDADGLPDDLEKRIGTDPDNPDTDGDSYLDGEEYRNNYNPLGEGLVESKNISPIDMAMLGKKEIEQPKTKGELRKDFLINEVKNKDKEQPDNKEGKESSENQKGYVIRGQAQANTVVSIYIYSDIPVVVTVETDEFGNFEYHFEDSLTEGEHEVYVAVNDDTGKVVSKSNPFSFLVNEARAVELGTDIFSAEKKSPREYTVEATSINYYFYITIFLVLTSIIVFVSILSLKTKKEKIIQ